MFLKESQTRMAKNSVTTVTQPKSRRDDEQK